MKSLLYIIRSIALALLLLLAPAGLRAQQAATGIDRGTTAEAAALDSLAQADEANDAQPDSFAISLITCAPGKKVYELYGHTALRVQEFVHGQRCGDWVLNYGTFDFHQDHFVWRFLLGQTDYALAFAPFNFFLFEYEQTNREVTEQSLNLTQAEAARMMVSLHKNLDKPVYRYNFLTDNCTTRALDQIINVLDGEIVWPRVDTLRTVRTMVDEFSARSPWDAFGQNLLLGAEVDRPATLRAQLFSPIYAKAFVAGAQIKSPDGTLRPLVRETTAAFSPYYERPERSMPGPAWVFGTVLALFVAVSVWEVRRRRYLWGLDALLLLGQGLAGCIIALLFFFSEHPAVGSNWLVLLLNPLPLLLFPWFMKRASDGRRFRGMTLEALMILAALVVPAVGLQVYPPALYLIIATLALRTAMHFLLTKPKK